jgi:hypothetical protein
MKNSISTLIVVFLTHISIAQNTQHNARVVGKINLGSDKEVSIIHDEITGCNHKTEIHEKDFFLFLSLGHPIQKSNNFAKFFCSSVLMWVK